MILQENSTWVSKRLFFPPQQKQAPLIQFSQNFPKSLLTESLWPMQNEAREGTGERWDSGHSGTGVGFYCDHVPSVR